jgi:hypothetical protein
MAEGWRVKLPVDVEDEFEVFVNGVLQQQGSDYELRGRSIVFDRPLVKAERLGIGRWFIGAFGIGTYRKDDSVDVSYTVAGQPRLAQGLEIRPPGSRAGSNR